MSDLSLRGVSKRFGAFTALDAIDLDVRDRDFVVLVGPSGCGKSTLLRMIAGLEEIDEGTLTIDGERMNETPAARRGLAMVFQSYALYPHMTVAENMSVGLRIARTDKAVIRAKVAEAARVLELEPLLDRRPAALSGGQRQRVAIGRAIVREPRVFLFDEPLSNLDAALRLQMRLELARLKEALDATVIYVTHDQVEAMTLATRIVVMNAGRIEQVGTPLDLYAAPANLFVAGFIGSPQMNFLPARVTATAADGACAIECEGMRTQIAATGVEPGDAVTLGIRPEDVAVVPEPPDGLCLTGRVRVVERLGSHSFAYLDLASDETLTVEVDGMARVGAGDALTIRCDPNRFHLFARNGSRLGASA